MPRKWLASLAAVAAVACGLLAATRVSRPSPDAGVALALEGRLRERAAALAARVTTLSDLPRLAAAVATDAATVRDLTGEELAFRPRPGEVITIAQSFVDGHRVTLLTLPEGAVTATANRAGATASVDGGSLVLSQTAKIVPLARADELSGLLTVAWPIGARELAAGILDPAIAARLELGQGQGQGQWQGQGQGRNTNALPLAGSVGGDTQFTIALPVHFPEGFATTATLAIAAPLPGHTPQILWASAAVLALLSAIAWSRGRGRAQATRQSDGGGLEPEAGRGAGTIVGAASSPAVGAASPGMPRTLPLPMSAPPPESAFASALASASAAASSASAAASASGSASDPFAAARAGLQRIGRYTIVRPLGGGGMAEVFLARAEGEAGFGKLVAFKILQPAFAALPQAVDLFLDEARLVAGLNHPNIVQTHDLGRAGDAYFIAMEYVDGADLARLVALVTARGGRVPLPIALSILCRICDGLNAAHTAVGPDGEPMWLVHRDVKSANVFVSRAGEVKIGDFGIAKASHAVRMSRTEIGEVKGTPGYMAPEQRLGMVVDKRADVYGVGAIAYEMLSGTPVNLDLVVLAARGTAGWPHLAPLASGRDDIPAALDAAIVKALAYERNDRFADCADFERALRAIGAAGMAEDKEVGAWARAELARVATDARATGAGGTPP